MQTDLALRLNRRVRELRKARGLSQEAFAELAGLKYKHYQSIEGGRKIDIRLSTLEKLARACGLSPGDLLDFPEPSPALAEDAARYATSSGGPRTAAPRTKGARRSRAAGTS